MDRLEGQARRLGFTKVANSPFLARCIASAAMSVCGFACACKAAKVTPALSVTNCCAPHCTKHSSGVFTGGLGEPLS